MNNEPVAYVDNVWINRPDLAMDLGIGQMFSRCQLSDHQIPLDTHPAEHDLGIAEAIGFDKGYKSASVKELTDEEIGQFKGEWYRGDYASFYDLVRAILRKAQKT